MTVAIFGALSVASVVVRTEAAGWEEIDAVRLLTSAGDGFGPGCDVCPAIHDPDQLDGDGDGAGDACDCEPANPAVRPAEVVGATCCRPR